MNPNEPNPSEPDVGNELLRAAHAQITLLTGQLETALASVTRWEAAYKSLAEEAKRAADGYCSERDRLNALNV